MTPTRVGRKGGLASEAPKDPASSLTENPSPVSPDSQLSLSQTNPTPKSRAKGGLTLGSLLFLMVKMSLILLPILNLLLLLKIILPNLLTVFS